MTLSRFCIAVAVLSISTSTAQAQTSSCGTANSGQCDYEPFNPVTCGDSFACGYDNFCLASENGFSVDDDCCQAPQPSACTFEADPQVCGRKSCPYSNLCLATLAGYSTDQCTSAPPECPAATADCSGDPANPYTCGGCSYATICDLESAGFDRMADCCQDARDDGTVCTANSNPVACGRAPKFCTYSNGCQASASGYNPDTQCCPAPAEGTICAAISEPVECGGDANTCAYPSLCEANAAGFAETECCKVPAEDVACIFSFAPVVCGGSESSCGYSNQCIASAAGHAEEDCCPGPISGDAVCTSDFTPVQCGDKSCEYSNQCEANNSGFTEDDCCPVGLGACTQEFEPVKCDNKCDFSNQGCAELAGFTSQQCCKQPAEVAACPANYSPVACSSANCIYNNHCIAELAGFDPNSCVAVPQEGVSTTLGSGSQSEGSSAAAASFRAFTALMMGLAVVGV